MGEVAGVPGALRRPVWLTAAQREIVWACTRFALSREEEYPGRECLQDYAAYLVDFRVQQQRPNPYVKLVVKGLRLPPDALPMMASDEIANLLVIWGNLPQSIAKVMNPSPTWIGDPPGDGPGVGGGFGAAEESEGGGGDA